MRDGRVMAVAITAQMLLGGVAAEEEDWIVARVT